MYASFLEKCLDTETWLAYFIAVIVLVAYVRKCPTDCFRPLIARRTEIVEFICHPLAPLGPTLSFSLSLRICACSCICSRSRVSLGFIHSVGMQVCVFALRLLRLAYMFNPINAALIAS